MNSEIYVKNIVLKDNSNAVIKSKWIDEDDRVEIELFHEDNIYTGKSNLKKNSSAETTKSALFTSDEQSICYELDLKKNIFYLVNSNALQDGLEIIFFKVQLTKISPEDFPAIALKLLDRIVQLQENEIKSTKLKEQSKKQLLMLEKLVAEKSDFDKTVLSKVQLLLNTKKSRIKELEEEVILLKDHNKFASFSSDYDQAEPLSKKVKSSKISPSSRSRSSKVSRPSTSTYISPVREKVISPRKNTPKKQQLFQFRKDSDDNSDDEFKSTSKKFESAKPKEDRLVMEKIKVTPKRAKDNDGERSDNEYFSPSLKARRRLNSSSSYLSTKSEEQLTEQLAQCMESDKSNEISQKKTKKMLHFQDSQDLFNSDEDLATPTKAVDEEIVPSSQNSDSPSIFARYPKRKIIPPTDSRKLDKKSKFSMDTMDILDDDSI